MLTNRQSVIMEKVNAIRVAMSELSYEWSICDEDRDEIDKALCNMYPFHKDFNELIQDVDTWAADTEELLTNPEDHELKNKRPKTIALIMNPADSYEVLDISEFYNTMFDIDNEINPDIIDSMLKSVLGGGYLLGYSSPNDEEYWDNVFSSFQDERDKKDAKLALCDWLIANFK